MKKIKLLADLFVFGVLLTYVVANILIPLLLVTLFVLGILWMVKAVL